MRKKSIYDELMNYLPKQNKKTIIEMRSSHAIHSLLNVLQLIKENFNKEDYEEILKKTLLAIRTGNPEKMIKKIKKLKLKDEKNFQENKK